MRSLVLTILWIILTINSTFAQNAVKLNKGDITPFEGILLTTERAEQAMKAEKKVLVLEDLKMTHMELIDFHKTDARVQRRKLSEAQFNSFWVSTGYFALGVILTGFAFKVNQKIGDM